MEPARLEAFTDGVVAIIITIMVLELRVPRGADLAALRADLGLLFWVSLVPFAIRWIDEEGFTALPTAAYGVVLLCAGFSYALLQRQIIAVNGPDSQLAAATRRDLKGRLSL